MLQTYVTKLLRGRRRTQHRVWAAKAAARARASGGQLTLEVDPTATVSPTVDVRVRSGSRNRLVIGAGVRLEDDVFILLADGDVHIGADSHLRQRVVLNVGGTLRLEGENILSWGTTVHCAERVTLEPQASCSEYVTITDSRHFQTDGDAWFYHQSESAPVRLGRNVWLAAKSTVMMGTDIGAASIVAAHAVVSGDVDPASLMAGTPARRIRSSLRIEP